MRTLLTYVLCVAILLPSLVIPPEAQAAPAPSGNFNVERECKNGKCVEGLMDLADAKTIQARKDGCLPPTGTQNETAWFEDHPMAPACLIQIKQIEEIQVKLQKVQTHYANAIEDDQEQMCRAEEANIGIDLRNQRDIAKVAASAACSKAKQQQTAQRCAGDSLCALMSSATPYLGAVVANKIIPANKRSGNCSARGDNCLVQMSTAFVKSVFGLFGGAWDLLKSAGRAVLNGVKNTAKRFWGWVTGAENKSSTSQLAAARASKNDGIFQQLKNDFFGTMGKLWAGMVGALNHWISNDIFCQEWAGTPRFSECKRPANGIACTNCKTVINGICAISGVIISEVIPAFLTGGLVTAAKYGVSAASRLSKLVRVSAASQRAVRNSSRLKGIIGPMTTVSRRIERMTVASRFGRTTLSAIQTAMRSISRYMLKPSVVAMKKSLTAMKSAARTGKTYVMMTPAGPMITFGTKAARLGGKVVLFPFENAMTVKSFEIGERLFERIFQKAGSARLFGGVRPALAAEASQAIGVIDDAYLDMQITRIAKRPGSEFVTRAEAEYVQTLRAQRGRVVDNYLDGKPTIPLKNLLDDLYPDLNYGKYAQQVGTEDIRKAESELMEAIGRMSNTAQKDRLMAEFQSHLSSSGRADAIAGSPTFTRTEVIANATLPDAARAAKALEVAKVDPAVTPPAVVAQLKLTVQQAHNAGDGAVFRYTYSEIKDKYRILSNGGFTNRQSELLIRSGLAGKANEGSAFTASVPESLVFKNAELSEADRFAEALKLINRDKVSEEEKIRLARTLQEAHLAGPQGQVFEYSWSELREKYRILVMGGYSKSEADLLIRTGLAGRPPVRELVKEGDNLFNNWPNDIVVADFPKRESELLQAIDNEIAPPKRTLFGLGRLDSTDADTIRANIQSLYFIDYKHSSPILNSILTGEGKVVSVSLATRYEKKAFENYRSAHGYLASDKPEISTNTLLEVHRRMMKDGVENVPASQLGVIRDANWYGNVPAGHEINDITLTNIKNNRYLTWVETSANNGKYTGQIQYPNTTYVKKEGLDIIRKAEPELVREIEHFQSVIREYQALNKKYPDPASVTAAGQRGVTDSKRFEELKAEFTELSKTQARQTQRLVEAMVDEQMDWFTRERTLLGELNTPEKVDQYANLVAEFQRNLVSIHPLVNGNGRSTRELVLNYALRKEGLPPARILDPDADIYGTLEDWQRSVKQGMLASDFMMDDLLERAKFGLPLDGSLDLVTPYSRPPVQMGLIGQKGKAVMDGVEYVEPRLYREIIRREMAKDPAFAARMQSEPLKAWDEIHASVTAVFKKNNVYFNHPKKGLERLEVGFVDDDFKLLFGRATSKNKAFYDFKMRTWYSDQVVWRGLASKTHVKTEGEIMNMFQNLDAHMSSNAVLGKVRGHPSPEALRTAALQDFEKYNNDLFGEGLVQMARDHSETGPMYGISYGYSTSKNRDVGKAFAMGAMVIAEYGAHKAPELQALLRSRVLVGARRAVKDVDLGRLKQVRPEFSYKYGRQQEVMGIGASDPDSIMIIQTLDADGTVALTYLRSTEDPSLIYVIKGDAQPMSKPEPTQIIKSIRLGT